MSEPLTDEQLTAIAATDAARTPGTWYTDRITDDVYAPGADSPVAYDVGEANAAFIALASWAVPALVAEIRRLQAENARLREKQDGAGWTVYKED